MTAATGTVETKKAKDKTLQEALDRFKECSEADRINREDALDDLKFRIGEQWPDDIAKARKINRRPCLTINRIPQFIRQVTGDIRQNKPSVKVLPMENSDEELAEVFTGIIRHIEQSSNATASYINAAEGAASCGMGWFRLVTEFSTDDGFDQDIKIKIGKNPFAAWCDPAAQEPDKSDARYAFVTELYGLDEFKARFPDASTEDFEDKKPATNTSTRDTEWWDGEYVRVAEYWVRKPDVKTIGLMADGTSKDLTGLSKEEIAQLAPTRTRKVQGWKVCSYLMNGSEILEGPMEWAGKYIPIIFVTGEEITLGDRTVRHGLIRFAKDPQRMFNYMRSASAEAIALQPKAPWVVTKDEIKGHEAYWNTAHTENRPYLIFNPDKNAGGSRPQRVEPPAPPTALWAEGENAAEDMHAATGIYPASLGAKSNETSGKAILARQRESDTGTFTYVDNLASAIAYCGRQLVDLIPKIYDTERTVRILGEDDSHEFVTVNQTMRTTEGDKIVNDLSAGKYDVIVTTGPSYTTKRAEAAESMMAFMQANPNAAGVIGDLIAKNMDWPGAEQIADRLKKLLPPGVAADEMGEDGQPPAPPPVDPLQLIQALTQKTLAEADIVKAAAAKSQSDLALQQAQMQTGVMGGVDPASIVPQIVAGLRAELAASGAENAQTLQALQVMAQGILTYLTAPKQIIRGPDGTPTAVAPVLGQAPANAAEGLAALAQPRPIMVDQAGRPAGMH